MPKPHDPPKVLDQKPPLSVPANHKHRFTTERFVNRKDITYQRCQDCGFKELPPNMFQVFGGSHTVIMWPT